MLEHLTNTAPTEGATQKLSEGDPCFWHSLIDEAEAARFLGFSIRTVQGLRYKGGGPKYCRISSRCIRYRRSDLCEWAEQRMRTSTSDLGQEDA